MATAMRMRHLLGRDIAEAARMASEYLGVFLGLEHELGRIAPGYRANLVLTFEFDVPPAVRNELGAQYSG